MTEKKLNQKLLETRLTVLDEAMKLIKDRDDYVRIQEMHDHELSKLIKRFPESKLSPLTAAQKRRAAELRRTNSDLRYYREQKREAEQVLAECHLDKDQKAIFRHRLKEAEEKIGPLNQKAKRLRKPAKSHA